MRRPCRFAACAAILALLVTGCGMQPAPDLKRVYAPVAQRPKAHPLVLIPGVMGSRLHAAGTGREVWPGSIWNFALGHNYSELAVPVPETGQIPGAPVPARLEAGGVFYDIAGEDFYREIVRTLTVAGGYTCVSLEEISAQTDCVLFTWDWRKGFQAGAAGVDALIERLRGLRHDPTLQVDIVAHSAGGLVARYYVRFGGTDVLGQAEPEITFAGGAKVRQLVLIGTPNYGSVTALQKAIMGDRLGLAYLRPETIATMPGIFHLLPHPDRTWMIDIHGRRLDVSVHDPETWRRYRWSIWDPVVRQRLRAGFGDPAAADAYLAAFERYFEQQLVRSARLHRALSIPVQHTPHKFIVFGSGCFPTPARCLLEEIDGQVYIRLHPRDIERPIAGAPYEELMIEPGDDTVTKASLLARDSLDADARRSDFPIAWSVFVCEHHASMPGNATFRDNLLNIVLYGAP
jgi:pimeloyl-ACP methyl ester carboxylesterase